MDCVMLDAKLILTNNDSTQSTGLLALKGKDFFTNQLANFALYFIS
jgi:hypothetical protein